MPTTTNNNMMTTYTATTLATIALLLASGSNAFAPAPYSVRTFLADRALHSMPPKSGENEADNTAMSSIKGLGLGLAFGLLVSVSPSFAVDDTVVSSREGYQRETRSEVVAVAENSASMRTSYISSIQMTNDPMTLVDSEPTTELIGSSDSASAVVKAEISEEAITAAIEEPTMLQADSGVASEEAATIASADESPNFQEEVASTDEPTLLQADASEAEVNVVAEDKVDAPIAFVNKEETEELDEARLVSEEPSLLQAESGETSPSQEVVAEAVIESAKEQES
jgi:hypothetical protein